MNTRQVLVAELFCLSLALILSAIWGDTRPVGLFAGFSAGVLNNVLLERDLARVTEMELEQALRKYIRSLFTRLALVTTVMAFIWRFLPIWLFTAALGFAAGVVCSLVLVARGKMKGGGANLVVSDKTEKESEGGGN
jgi:hypothetical protein